MWQMPERRRLGTGENITRSGLTAHWDMRRRTSSVLSVINGEQLIVLMYVDKLVFSLLLRTPISSGPRNGEQPIMIAEFSHTTTWILKDSFVISVAMIW